MGLTSNLVTERSLGTIKANSSMIFSINGVRVPTPNSITCIVSDFTWGNTDYTGAWVGYNIRRRRKVYWNYTASKKDDVYNIYNLIENQYKNNKGNMFFTIKTPFIGTDSLTMTMYKGDTTQYEPVLSNGTDGVVLWKYQLNWIEKAGIKFAEPGAIPT